MPTRKYSSRSQQTTLTATLSSGSTSTTVVSGSALMGGVTVTGGETFTVVINPDTALEEIVDVIGVATNTLTIVRGIDGSSGQTHSAGSIVRHMAIGRDYREANQHIENVTTAHGLTIAEVLTRTGSQTVSNKTLASNLAAGTYKITGLGDPSSAQDAATKNYVDTGVNSGVAAAATSATSAATSATSSAASASASATSATSAATSATAAATSQSSAATSATSSATSASSSATSASAAVTSATSAATSASAAATSAASAVVSATSAATSASSSATSASSAAASVASIAAFSASASSSATAAATSATSAAASASAAAGSTSAAAVSASAAATSATSAATSASAAATSATSSATSATASASSATSAATSATASATSATSAATSASASATSATSAALSATSAATSASDAATTYDNFDDRYLGSKSSAPTVDNDGNTLLVGAIYWNSALNNMYVWSGSTWVQIATTSAYSAPTLGSTTLASGSTVSTVSGLTLSGGLAAADPSVALGLATKQYVDNITTGLNFHAPVKAASVANLGVTYNNGTSGVGATLTADTLRAFNTLDGQSVSVGERVLIKDQTNQIQNGVYTLTNNGSAGVTAWVLTRATDQDNSVAGEMNNGDDFSVIGGTVNAGKSFVNSTVGTITIGTTNITYSTYYAGLPDQSTNAGKYLTTDGTTPSWGTVAGYSAPTLGSTSIASGATVTTIAGLTLTTPVINSISTSGVSQGATLYNNITTGSVTVGGILTSGDINLANGTAFNGTINIASGAGTTNKTVNIGTSSTSGTTTINIGSAGAATNAVTIRGTVTVPGDINLSAAGGPGSVIDELILLLMGAI